MLKQLCVQGDVKYEKSYNVMPVNFQVHHIVEILMVFLKNIELDGSSKLTIYFADKPEAKERYHVDSDFKVSWYYVNYDKDKIYQKYFQNRDCYYLQQITNVLMDIAVQNRCGEEILKQIESAAGQVEENEFCLSIPIKKLEKVSGDKQYRAKVYRKLMPEGEMWTVDIEGKDFLFKNISLMKAYTHVSKEGVYFKAKWIDHTFVITDRLGRVMVKVLPDSNALQLFDLKGVRETLDITKYQIS